MAGGKEVNNVVVKLSNMIADVQLDIFVPYAQVVLFYMQAQYRAHDSYYKSEKARKTQTWVH